MTAIRVQICRSVEALGVIGIPAQDLVPLDRVHECRIGLTTRML